MTYANSAFSISAKTLGSICLNRDIRSVDIYCEKDLPENFRALNRETLSFLRGAGYWIWKPWIILDKLSKIENGDVLIYLDAGVLPSAKFFEAIKHLSLRDVNVWESELLIREWTDTRVVKEYEELVAREVNWDEKILWSGFLIFKKTENTLSIVNEWNRLCQIPTLLRPDSMGDFQRGMPKYWHRHDQSLLSLICSTNYSEVGRIHHEGELNYKEMFDIHRKPNLRSYLFVSRIRGLVTLRRMFVRKLPIRVRIFIRRLKAKHSKSWLSNGELDRLVNLFGKS